MKTSYEIIPERSLVHVTYRFHPTYRQWAEMMSEIFKHPQFRPGFDFLFDKRQAEDAATTDYAEAVASFFRKNSHRMGRCAIVAKGALAFGMSRMTESYCTGDSVRAFTNLEEALLWLRPTETPAHESPWTPPDASTNLPPTARFA